MTCASPAAMTRAGEDRQYRSLVLILKQHCPKAPKAPNAAPFRKSCACCFACSPKYFDKLFFGDECRFCVNHYRKRFIPLFFVLGVLAASLPFRPSCQRPPPPTRLPQPSHSTHRENNAWHALPQNNTNSSSPTAVTLPYSSSL